MRVLAFGDNVVDIYVNQGVYYPGGNALNFSVYAKMLEHHAEYIGVFGDDAFALHVRNVLDELHIPHPHSRFLPGENGYAEVLLENRDRTFLCSNRGGVSKNAPWELSVKDLSYIRSFELLHTSCHSYADDVLPLIAAQGVPISYDFSGKWDLARFDQICPSITYAFFSASHVDEQALTQAHQRAVERGCKLSIATMGSDGASIYDGSSLYRLHPEPVEVVDTLGAGDAFVTAFLLDYLSGEPRDIQRSMRAGHQFAGKIIGLDGAFGHPHPYTPNR